MASVILGVMALLAIGGLLNVLVKVNELVGAVKDLTENLRVPSAAAEEKPEGKPDPMDEGFENLMRFTVMGKTGFEDGDEG